MTETHHLDPQHWLARHGNYLFRYAMTLLRDERLAEDAVQECLLAGLQAQAGYTGRASERTWLTGILKHKIIDILRRKSREDTHESMEEMLEITDEDSHFDSTGHWAQQHADWGDPARAFENRRFWQVLEYCLENMPARLARLFMLREIANMDSETICKELDITTTNLWTMLYRSRVNLRDCLEHHWIGKEKSPC